MIPSRVVSTTDEGEILIVCFAKDDLKQKNPKNVTVRGQTELANALYDTEPTIPNPVYVELESRALMLAAEELARAEVELAEALNGG